MGTNMGTHFFKVILLTAYLLSFILGNSLSALADCALVLTSPEDGAVFTVTNEVDLTGYVKAHVEAGDTGSITVLHNDVDITPPGWSGTFTTLMNLFEHGSLPLTLVTGENRIEVTGTIDPPNSCSTNDEITVYYEPNAETGPDDELGGSPEPGDGPCKSQNYGGDPINIATGNVTTRVTDFTSTVPGYHPALQLKFERFYNSQSEFSGSLGRGWTHTYELDVILAEAGGLVGVRRASGQVLYFKDNGDNTFTPPKGAHNQLILSGGQYLFKTIEDITYTFNGEGNLLFIKDIHDNQLTMQYQSVDFPEQLTGVEDDFGRTLQFEYNYNTGLLNKMTDPASREYIYAEDAAGVGNLYQVTYPTDTDPEIITYQYGDSADPYNLTAIIDENGHTYTYSYDAEDRAYISYGQDNDELIEVDFSGNDTIVLTNSLGDITHYTRSTQDDIGYITAITAPENNGGHCSTCGEIGTFSYSGDYLERTVTDARGTSTRFTYDTRGNLLTMLEAENTPVQRLVEYVPDPVFNKPVQIVRQSVDTLTENRTINIIYDATTGLMQSMAVHGYVNGQLETRTTIFPLYTNRGQLREINGPRSDVNDNTTFEYYPDNDADIFNRGMFFQVTNGLNHVTEFSDYNQFGQAETIKDANNVVTTLAYDPRGRLLSITVNGKITEYDYDKVGNLKTITPPDSKGITGFVYTNNDRLQDIQDQLGNYLRFSYDTEGNQTSEKRYTYNHLLQQYLNYEYTPFNYLNRIVNPDLTFTLLEPDENGNVAAVTDPVDYRTDFDYDELNRLKKRTQPGTVVTDLTYDSHDNPDLITDPVNVGTDYDYSDFGEAGTRDSKDSGVTSFYYDPAGNLITIVDANQTSVHYGHDALNRLDSITYTPPDAGREISFVYDDPAVAYSKGRLTSYTDSSGTNSYQYDLLGRVTQESRTIDSIAYTTSYGYNDRNNLAILTYPTGTQITFQRYDNERLSGILINSQPLTQNVSYRPFGPEEDFTFGANLFTVDRTFLDNTFQVKSITTPTLDYQYLYYADARVKSITGIPVPEFNTGRTEYVTKPTSNQLDYITPSDSPVRDYILDDNGNITSDGVYTYYYNQPNQLIEVKEGATVIGQYSYDPFGRRVSKTVPGTSTITHFHYDRQHRLIAETDGTGAPLRDYVYQNNHLVAVKLHTAPVGIYYVINDHLGTPQQIVDTGGTVVWKAAFLPFGKAQVLIDTISSNIRFPGQYFDAETGLHYNHYRFYDPATGRYLTPDPVGLVGGINLYGYVLNDPVNYIDPMGLNPLAGALTGTAIGGPVGGVIGLGLGLYGGQQLWDWMMNEGEGEECEVPTTPPDGLVENPHRPGSWGEIGSDGKFKEKWRRDKGRPEIKSPHGSTDHIHVGDKWYPIKKK